MTIESFGKILSICLCHQKAAVKGKLLLSFYVMIYYGMVGWFYRPCKNPTNHLMIFGRILGMVVCLSSDIWN